MRDPHVVALRYSLDCDESTSFSNPAPVDGEKEQFKFRLEAGVLRVEMKDHHSTAEPARAAVEPFLRSWELADALEYGWRGVRFRFERPELVDRSPPPPDSPQTVGAQAIASAELFGDPTVRATRAQYPSPPSAFHASPEVETLWDRYEGYLEGREPLLDMAHASQTYLERAAGGRRKVASKYSVSPRILDTMGRLAAEIGDAGSARKFSRRSQLRPPSASEKAWLEAAIKALIRRVGEHCHDPKAALPHLTIADLPEL